MSDVIHRTTLEQRVSVNTPDYPVEEWIINPDLSAVQGVAKKYWKIVGDDVQEMTQTEKDAVDAALDAIPETGGSVINSCPRWLLNNDQFDLHSTADTYGIWVDPEFDIYVSSCKCLITEAATGSFTCSIYDLDGNRLGFSDGGGSTAAIGESEATFSTPVILRAGTTYRVGISADAKNSSFAARSERGGRWLHSKLRWVISGRNPSQFEDPSEATNVPWFALSS